MIENRRGKLNHLKQNLQDKKTIASIKESFKTSRA